MKVIQIDQIEKDPNKAIDSLHVVDKSTPKPGPGQVLIRIEAAPCNPSDLLFLEGSYGVKKPFPAVPGWEGAGTVVESGGGLYPWWLKGKRVWCGGQAAGDGTWAEYYVAEAKTCVPLRKGVSSEQGATLIINPLTAYGMVERAISQGHKAFIQTAASSQVGRLVQHLARLKDIPLINIVRRKEQVEELKASGEKWVLNSEDPDFFSELKELSHKLHATVVFEAIGGDMTGKILAAMPVKSKAFVYGALAEKPCGGIAPLSLIFERKTVEGFWLTDWIQKSGFWNTLKATNYIQKMIEAGSFGTKIRRTVGFEGWKEALHEYKNEMSAGKVILKPNLK